MCTYYLLRVDKVIGCKLIWWRNPYNSISEHWSLTSILQRELFCQLSENLQDLKIDISVCCPKYMYLGSEMFPLFPHHLSQFHPSFNTNSKHSCKIILIMLCLKWSWNSQCIFWLLIKNVSYMIHWMQPNSIQSLSQWQSEKKWELIKICFRHA